jgi:ADP-ribose pyrophosphatase
MSGTSEPTLLRRRLLHQGRELKITLDSVRLPNGHELDLEMVHHPGAAAVVPFVADDELLLVRQYRWAASQWIYEIPAGKLRPGEAPEACAARELEEEVGHRAGRLERLGDIWTAPGFTDEVITLFTARELTPVAQALEPDEVLEVERVPLARALDLARDGRLRDAKSLCAILHVLLRAKG